MHALGHAGERRVASEAGRLRGQEGLGAAVAQLRLRMGVVEVGEEDLKYILRVSSGCNLRANLMLGKIGIRS
jgi:hypothetical protein